jgi:hypothetical protein
MKKTWWAALAVVGLVVSGCGGDEDSDADSGRDDNTSDSSGTDPGTDVDTDVDEPATEDDLPVFCDLLTAEQVGEAVGATVTVATGPFDACEFKQEDVYEYSGSLGAVIIDNGNGGYDAYKTGGAAALTDPVTHDIAGVGEDAFVTTGTFGGGESLQAGGGVLVGGIVYTVNISQAADHTEDEMVAISEKLMTLMVEAAG